MVTQTARTASRS